MAAMITVDTRDNRANPAGSPFRTQHAGDVTGRARRPRLQKPWVRMPTGRSTFTKRQTEQTRQQRQRDKAERRNLRKQDQPVFDSVDEMAELREHTAAQAALFKIGAEETDTPEESAPDARVGE